jgi:hypothetical protein
MPGEIVGNHVHSECNALLRTSDNETLDKERVLKVPAHRCYFYNENRNKTTIFTCFGGKLTRKSMQQFKSQHGRIQHIIILFGYFLSSYQYVIKIEMKLKKLKSNMKLK